MKKTILTLGLTLLATANVFGLPSLIGKADYKASSVSDLNFNLSWENLEIQESNTDNKILVNVYCNKKKFAPKVKLSGSTLVIESAPIHNVLFPMERKICTVIVTIPSGMKFNDANINLSSGNMEEIESISADKIVLELSSGNIKAGKLKAQNVKAVSSSGNIKIDSIEAATAIVQASSGNISVDSAQAQDYTMKTSSGKISAEEIRANNAVFNATSGNVKLKDITVQEITISASSGTIAVDGLLVNKISASTSSGTIGLELNGAPTKNSNISTSSGTLFVSMPKNSAATISASTSSGRFVNAFKSEKVESHANYEKDINGGGALLSLNSTSGNITLDVGDGIAAYGRASLIEDDDPVIVIDRPIF